MELTLEAVAEIVGAEVFGDQTHVVRGVCDLEENGPDAGELLGFLAGGGEERRSRSSKVGSLLVAEVPDPPDGKNYLKVEDPYLAFSLVAQRFHPLPSVEETEIHETAVLGRGVELEAPVRIGAHVVLGDHVRIGRGTSLMAGVCLGAATVVGRECLLYPHVVVYEQVRIGDRVRVHAGSVLGSDGFGFARAGARFVRIPQVGTVVLEDDVEIGASTCIDRATLGETRIRRGTKIDNLVHIAHNCEIGEDSGLAAQVGLAGSVKVGDRCLLGGQVGLSGHLEICDEVAIGAKSGVPSSIEEAGYYLGLPARPGRQTLRIWAGEERIDSLRQELMELRRRVAELEARRERGAGG
ncbi:MAG: UDP-3-O-(3-hydroxymyristoyl)glucosamine N-acyltransferase [Planctomycetota bacterium]